MGAWGPGLYQSDTASDLKAKLARFVRLPIPVSELVERIVAGEAAASDSEDEDSTTFWLVLADQLHRYAIEHQATFARALTFIESGDDDRMMAALDMNPRDREKRRKELDGLKARLAVPHPKPVNRKLLKAPEPFTLAEGEIWAFPVEDGNPPNTYFPADWIDQNFKPNGWAAFAVSANRHLLGWFAASFVIRLQVDGPERPDLRTCLASRISGTRYGYVPERLPPSHVAGWVEISKPVLKKMRAERIGATSFDQDAVARLINGFVVDEAREPGSLASRMHCWQRIPGSSEWLFSAQPTNIRVDDLLLKSKIR
jgi:hypothetical protein